METQLLGHRAIKPVLCFIATLFVSSICRGEDVSAPTLSELKTRYPVGSIYLSYTSLNNFRVHLNDPAKYGLLIRQSVPGQNVLEQFRKYLNDEFGHEREVSRSTAFLKIDFVNRKVMDKNASDTRGTVNELTQYWVASDVWGLAVFCDAMLRKDEYAAKKVFEMKLKGTRLKASWEEIPKLKEDPYVQTRSLDLYLAEFNTQIKQRSAELEEIRKSDPVRYAEIKTFENQFASPGRTFATAYPTRPLRLVVAFAPGGAADILARVLAPKLGEQLGQQIVVDNRPGANGVVGFELVAKGPADGYTLLIGHASGLTINPLLGAKLPYDPVQDFAPVSLIARIPYVLAANPSFPAKSVKELIALAKATPGKITYASVGIGSFNHLAGERFKSMAGVDLVHVPYKGAGGAIVHLSGGHVEIAFVTVTAALPQVRAGKLKALAVTSDMRLNAAPEIPTMSEAGLPGLEIVGWFGVLAPARTPKAVVSRLNEEIVKAVRSPEIHGRFAKQGFEPIGTTTDQFAAVIRSDIAKWGKVIKQAGIRAE